MKQVLAVILGLGALAAAAILVVGQEGDAERGRVAGTATLPAGPLPTVTVYKSPTCGCCRNWVAHLREHGFEVETVDTDRLDAVKVRYGVPAELRSCHTAIVDGKVVEGHVPADVIMTFLADSTDATGLAVPGMPMGSPGMEGPYREAYDVLSFGGEGDPRIYAVR
jgi:hypothetical protein